MPMKHVELEFQDKADLIDEISAIDAAAERRNETALATLIRNRDGWWYARIEFVEAAQ